MHIVMIILAVLSSIGVWYWRAQRAKDAIDLLSNAAGHAKGAYNRNRFKKKSEGSVLAGIDDPQSAAAVLMVCLANEKSAVTSPMKNFISEKLVSIVGMAPQQAEEAIEFGDWASGEVVDTGTVVRKFLPIFREALNVEQRRELLDLLGQVAVFDGDAEPIQLSLIKRLREGLSN